MTREEAKANQERIAKHFKLDWWYGTDCKKCCGVYPKLIIGIDGFNDLVRYECEVCGTTTKPQIMPWVARDEWNAGKFIEQEMRLF